MTQLARNLEAFQSLNSNIEIHKFLEVATESANNTLFKF